MGSFILRTRLKVLESNLRDVEKVMELAQARAKDIDALKTLLSGPNGVRDLARRLTTRVERSLKDVEENDPDSAIQNLTAASTLVLNLSEMIDNSQHKIDSLLRPVELGTRRIQERLKAAVKSVPDPDGPQTPAAWKKEKQLSSESEPLFADYVDLLRGLALRETGVERGICELADRLLEGCDVGSSPWKSLAIPSYRGVSGLTPAQIIRLSFPEWTIWALPLAASEFGRVILHEDTELGAKVRDAAPRIGPALADLLADAFATYAVGPAYACAAVLMRLDPRPPQAGGPAIDDLRAQTIFGMLTEADKNAGLGVSFADIRKRLHDDWTEAVGEAGATPAPGTDAADLVTFFWGWAERHLRTAKYSASSWQKAHRLEEAFARRLNRQPATAEDATTIGPDKPDVRDMLNAAWLLRLKIPDQADAIAQAVLDVWQQDTPKSQKPGRFAVPAQPGGRTA